MQSVLLISEDKKKASDYINKFCAQEKIDFIDISINIFEKAVGIEDVRNIQKKIFLKPFRSRTKAVIIETYADITTQAQNSLLKILEEPPNNTIIIIAASKPDSILPTILSRCKIVELNSNKQKLSDEEIVKLLNCSIVLLQGSVGERLKLAQDVSKNKDEVLPWLEKMIIFIRSKLIENIDNSNYFNLLKTLQKIYQILKTTNVTPRIALENLFLSLATPGVR